MAINRGPFNALIDDDGSNTVGTIWNKAQIKNVLLDPMDAAYAPIPSAAGFTPFDASGASLTFGVGTTGVWYKIGQLIHVQMFVVYPATANPAVAKIGGLAFNAAAGFSSGLAVSYGADNLYNIMAGQPCIQMFHRATSAARTNADMSGQVLQISGAYLID